MKIQKAFTQPNNEAHIYKDGAINSDIRDYMESIFPKAVKQCTNVEKIFKGRNEKETAHLIWKYLRNYCTYRRDPESNQIIRQPAYFVNRGNNTGDCKTFATFARCVYAAIYPDLPTAFKYTGYRSETQNPSHVYTVVKDKAGNEIVIDGCYNYFNREKKYTLALPLKFETMRVSSLSGLNELADELNDKVSPEKRDRIKRLAECRRILKLARTEYDAGIRSVSEYQENINYVRGEMEWLQGINKKLTPEQKAAKKAKRKAATKKRNEKAKKGLKKFAWGVAFVNLLPIRAAFTSIVAMNFNSLAHNLRFVYNNRTNPDPTKNTKKEWEKIEKIWQKLGGLKKALMKAITLGAKHKPLFLSKKAKAKFEARKKGTKGYAGCYSVYDDGICAAPVVAAAIAAAAGVIAAIIPALMSGLKKGGQTQEAQQVQEQGQELVQQYKQDPQAVGREAAQGADEVVEEAGGEPGEDAPEPINAMDAGTTNLLFDTLGKVAQVGIQAAGTAVAKKAAKKPKLKKFLDNAGTAADDYVTGVYLRKSGYKKAAQDFSSSASKYLPYALGGGALLLGALFLSRKK